VIKKLPNQWRILKTTTKWSAFQRETWRQWRFAWVLRQGWDCGRRSCGEDEPRLEAMAFAGARGGWRWRRRQGARVAWRPKKTSLMRTITWRPVAPNSFSYKCNRTKPWKCNPSSWIRFLVLSYSCFLDFDSCCFVLDVEYRYDWSWKVHEDWMNFCAMFLFFWLKI